MGWECFCVVGFALGPLLQGRARILHLQYFFKYVLAYFLHLDNYLVTFLHNTICRAQLFCPILLSASEFLPNMLFNYHLLYFCTALSLIIKRPARDACLCMGELPALPAPAAPPAPHFVFLITL